VNAVYLDFSTAVDTVSLNTLIDVLMEYRLDKRTGKWIEHWLN